MSSKKTLQTSGSPFKRVNRLRRQKANFRIEYTNVTTKIISEDPLQPTLLYSPSVYRFKHFHLFREIKKEILSNIETKKMKVPHYEKKDITYFMFNDHLNQIGKDFRNITLQDCVEYDIVKAYYQAARNLGYISNEYFQKCVNLPKLDRLRLIGSIATKKIIMDFEDGELKDIPMFKEDELLRRVWFHICYSVSEAMIEFKRLIGDDFLFFWVDGIYLNSREDIADITNYVYLQHGYQFTKMPIDNIDIKFDNKSTTITVHKINQFTGEVKPKMFTVNKKKSKVDILARLAEIKDDDV